MGFVLKIVCFIFCLITTFQQNEVEAVMCSFPDVLSERLWRLGEVYSHPIQVNFSVESVIFMNPYADFHYFCMDAAVQSDDYVYAILSTNDVSLTGCHRYEFNNQTDTVIQTSLQLSSSELIWMNDTLACIPFLNDTSRFDVLYQASILSDLDGCGLDAIEDYYASWVDINNTYICEYDTASKVYFDGDTMELDLCVDENTAEHPFHSSLTCLHDITPAIDDENYRYYIMKASFSGDMQLYLAVFETPYKLSLSVSNHNAILWDSDIVHGLDSSINSLTSLLHLQFAGCRFEENIITVDWYSNGHILDSLFDECEQSGNVDYFTYVLDRSNDTVIEIFICTAYYQTGNLLISTIVGEFPALDDCTDEELDEGQFDVYYNEDLHTNVAEASACPMYAASLPNATYIGTLYTVNLTELTSHSCGPTSDVVVSVSADEIAVSVACLPDDESLVFSCLDGIYASDIGLDPYVDGNFVLLRDSEGTLVSARYIDRGHHLLLTLFPAPTLHWLFPLFDELEHLEITLNLTFVPQNGSSCMYPDMFQAHPWYSADASGVETIYTDDQLFVNYNANGISFDWAYWTCDSYYTDGAYYYTMSTYTNVLTNTTNPMPACWKSIIIEDVVLATIGRGMNNLFSNMTLEECEEQLTDNHIKFFFNDSASEMSFRCPFSSATYHLVLTDEMQVSYCETNSSSIATVDDDVIILEPCSGISTRLSIFTSMTCVLGFSAERIDEDPEDGHFLLLSREEAGETIYHIARYSMDENFIWMTVSAHAGNSVIWIQDQDSRSPHDNDRSILQYYVQFTFVKQGSCGFTSGYLGTSWSMSINVTSSSSVTFGLDTITYQDDENNTETYMCVDYTEDDNQYYIVADNGTHTMCNMFTVQDTIILSGDWNTADSTDPTLCNSTSNIVILVREDIDLDSGSVCTVENGSYYFSYSDLNLVKMCRAQFHSIATVDDGTFTLESCSSLDTYRRPLNTNFACIAETSLPWLSSETLSLAVIQSDASRYVVLIDQVTPRTYMMVLFIPHGTSDDLGFTYMTQYDTYITDNHELLYIQLTTDMSAHAGMNLVVHPDQLIQLTTTQLTEIVAASQNLLFDQLNINILTLNIA